LALCAIGVGQWRAHVQSDGVPAVGRLCGTFPSFWLVPYSVALGVGYSPRDHEDPITAVRGADSGSGNAIPPRIIPERGKRSENVAHSSNKDR